MQVQKKLFTLFLFLSSHYIQANAQAEVAYLNSKEFSAAGFGAFLNFALPVSETGAITAEAGFYYFKRDENNVAIVPFLIGYRHMLQEGGFGFYLEPNAGYNIGGTDIQKYNEVGSPIPDGNGGWLEQQVKGFTTGVGVGYIFPGSFALNIGLRYQRVFVPVDPSLNLFSLRLSRPLSFGRRND
jgi:hypothetical protein